MASPLTEIAAAPRQPDEGAPQAWLIFEPEVVEGLRNLCVGDEIIVVTWLDRARRDVLAVHPRGDPSRPMEGYRLWTAEHHSPAPSLGAGWGGGSER